jgi:GTP cyclohydrolase IA
MRNPIIRRTPRAAVQEPAIEPVEAFARILRAAPPNRDKRNQGDSLMIDGISTSYREILLALGEDPNRNGLRDTPMRAAKAMSFLTSGYTENLQDIVNNAVFDSDNDEMVLVRDIELYSLCEHHLLPFIGRCHVAYLPSGKVLGLSKIARIVDMFARRLQIQENMTLQIANAVEKVTGANGVGVIVEAKHMCMMMRGVQKQNSVMTTSVMLGRMRDSAPTRNEFLTLVHGGRHV